MTNKALCFDSIIEKLHHNVLYAKKQKYIRKPYSWALYETWKLVNAIEKSRRIENDSSDL